MLYDFFGVNYRNIIMKDRIWKERSLNVGKSGNNKQKYTV